MNDDNTELAAAINACRSADGLLRWETIREAGRDPNSPIHQHLTWDPAKALDKCHKEEVRVLVRKLRIEVQISEEVTVRVPTYVPAMTETATWRRTDEIEPASDLARKTVLRELSYVAGALGRARKIAIALGVENEIETLIAGVASVDTRLRSKTDA
jgi:hypothetical protein